MLSCASCAISIVGSVESDIAVIWLWFVLRYLQTQLAKAPKDASKEVEDRIFEEQRELVSESYGTAICR